MATWFDRQDGSDAFTGLLKLAGCASVFAIIAGITTIVFFVLWLIK